MDISLYSVYIWWFYELLQYFSYIFLQKDYFSTLTIANNDVQVFLRCSTTRMLYTIRSYPASITYYYIICKHLKLC